MGRYSPDTNVDRYNNLVASDPEFYTLLDGNAFYWLDHFSLQKDKKKKILMLRNTSDYIIRLKLYARSKIPMTLNLYGDPVITDIGLPVTEPTTMPRNVCPEHFRLPALGVYSDGEYESESGIHAGSMRIDIGFQGNVTKDLEILAHQNSGTGGSLIEVKNVSEETGEFNILVSWSELLEESLK
jgi:hypothetical protein